MAAVVAEEKQARVGTTGAPQFAHRSARSMAELRTTGRWMGPHDRPLLGWLTTLAGTVGDIGVVIVPPVGYEYWTTHRTLRSLAERLARQGCTVLRVDHDGTGDSAGSQWDPDRVSCWRATIGHAAAELSRLGTARLVIVGLRLGASFALLDGHAAGAEGVVAWAPVARGRRYVKEVQMLATPVPSDSVYPERDGAVVSAGTVFSAQTLNDLAALDLTTLDERPAGRVIVIDRPDRASSTDVVDRLEALGAKVDHLVLPGSEHALDQPTEYATVPDEIIDEICLWVGTSATTPASLGSPISSATIAWDGKPVTEEVVELGDAHLVGVLGRPPTPPLATVVFLNSGSEPHVGPGRAWVEYGRALVAAGYATVRLDFSGWGESPDLDHAPGRPYDAHTIGEAASAVRALDQLGLGPVVLAGLCAGAWIALRVAVDVPLGGIIAINPQLYWQDGDPVEADIVAETHARRVGEISRYKSGARWGLWTALDMVGARHPASTWLRQLVTGRARVLMIFTDGDDGLQFLEDRVGRAWRRAQRHGAAQVAVVPDIDHAMHRQWRRVEVIAAMRAFLDGWTRSG